MTTSTNNPKSTHNDEMPEWLRAIRGDGPATSKTAAAKDAPAVLDEPAPQSQSDDLPDWLRALRSTEERTSPVSTSSQPPHIIAETLPNDVETLDGPEEVLDDTSSRQAQLTVEDQSPVSEFFGKETSSPEARSSDSDERGRDLWEQILAEEGLSVETLDEEEKPAEMGDMSFQDWMRSTMDEATKRQSNAERKSPPPVKASPPEVEEPVKEEVPETLVEAEEEDSGQSLWEQILAEEGLSVETLEEEEKPAEMGDMSFQDWMRSTMDEATKRQSDAERKSPPPVKASPPEVEEPVKEEVPETLVEAEEEDSGQSLWEQILAEEGLLVETLEEEEKPAEMGDMSFQDWMRSTMDEATKRQSDAEKSPPPQKQETSPEEGSPLSEVSLPVEAVTPVDIPEHEIVNEYDISEDELPDWLREDEGTSETAETGVWLSDETIAEEAEMISDVGKVWTSLEAREDDGLVVEDELPDWLREDKGTDEVSETGVWLSDETIAEEAEAISDVGKVWTSLEAREDDGLVVEDELPDWLREDEGTGEAEASAWLDDETTHEETEAINGVERPETSLGERKDDGLIVKDELPNWLREEEGIGEAAEAASWLSNETTYDEVEEIDELAGLMSAEISEDNDLAIEEALPDWLKEEADIGQVDEVAVSEIFEADMSDEVIPDWLQDEQSPVSEEGGLPDVLPDIQEAEEILEEVLPDWLQQGQLEDTVEVAALLEEQPELIQESQIEMVDDIPAWLSDEVEEVETNLDLQPVGFDAEVQGTVRMLKNATSAVDSGDLGMAVEIFQSLIASALATSDVVVSITRSLDKYPDEYILHELLGDAQIQNGQLNKAVKAYRAALNKI